MNCEELGRILERPPGRRAARVVRFVEKPKEAKARALCVQYASFSPVAVEAVKASVRAALSAPLAAGLAYENEMNTLCFAAGDHREGIKAFEEKRPASFSR